MRFIQMAAQSPDKTGFSIALGQDAPPGETWVYNNAAIQTLDRVLEGATGQEPADFAEQRLFAEHGVKGFEVAREMLGKLFGADAHCASAVRSWRRAAPPPAAGASSG